MEFACSFTDTDAHGQSFADARLMGLRVRQSLSTGIRGQQQPELPGNG